MLIPLGQQLDTFPRLPAGEIPWQQSTATLLLLPCRRRRARITHCYCLLRGVFNSQQRRVSEAHMDEGEAHRSAPAAARRVDTFQGKVYSCIALAHGGRRCSSSVIPHPARRHGVATATARRGLGASSSCRAWCYATRRPAPGNDRTSQQSSLPLTWHYCWRDD